MIAEAGTLERFPRKERVAMPLLNRAQPKHFAFGVHLNGIRNAKQSAVSRDAVLHDTTQGVREER
jgi:hypothetical protein